MIVDVVVNTTVYIPFTLLDSAGDPETGKVDDDFTKSAYLVSTPATTATCTVTENASGTYRIAFTPTAVGVWHVTWSVSVDGETVRFEETVQVVTASQADPMAYLTGLNLAIPFPSPDSGDFTIYQGDDYQAAESRQLVWNLAGAPDLTGATVTLSIVSSSVTLTKTATLSDEGEATQVVIVTLTDTQTATLYPSEATSYDLSAVLANSNVVTLARGQVRVKEDVP